MVFGGRRGRMVAGVPTSAFRPSWVFLLIVGVFVAFGALLWAGLGWTKGNVFVFVTAGWVISLCFHEYAHAVLALRAGDLSIADRGYLTLNPLKYTHPILSIVLPMVFLLLGGIALPGGAVWVDRHAFRGRIWDSMVSLFGPLTNFVLAIVLIAPFWLDVDLFGAHADFWAAIAFLAHLQLIATLLNLVPIPGTDGGNALQPWLSPEWQRYFDMFAPYGMLLLFALILSPLGRAFFGVVETLGGAMGIPPYLQYVGWDLYRFWSF
jgi:Zn-dependent protease